MSTEGWFDNGHVDAALEVARDERKLLLIDFWSATCLGCAKLVKRTYGDPDVGAFLREHFVTLKFQTSRTPEQFKRLNGRTIHMWHPHLVLADHRLSEVRRIVGYLPAGSLIGHLRIGLGQLALYHKDFTVARDHFAAASGNDRPQEVAAEGLYWLGVAEYRLRGFDALKATWGALASRFPHSDWTDRADCLDVVIPETGFDPHDPESIRLTGEEPRPAPPRVVAAH